jgi:hypothetical protein
METLELDVTAYTETMADALALMHWGAQIDANDVEFVLAPPRVTDSPTPSPFQSEYLGTHSMWILDFDCCRPLSLDQAGVEQACVAFFKNDPFYPRPGSGEAAGERLWEVFKQKFLVTSRAVLGEMDEDKWSLAENLVARIEAEGRTRRTEKHTLI